jgi:hypothetical protein
MNEHDQAAEVDKVTRVSREVYDDIMKLCEGKNIGGVVAGFLFAIRDMAKNQCNDEHRQAIVWAMRGIADRIERGDWND